MNKKRIFITALAMLLAATITSCTTEPSTSTAEAENSQVVSTAETTEEDSAPSEENSSEIQLENETDENGIGGGSELKSAYSFHYFNVDGSLIDYIGSQEFDEWWKENEGKELSVLDVVKDFNISKEDFIAITRPKMDDAMLEQIESLGYTEESWYDENVYSMEEINAIYSNDPVEINRVFCSPIAVFNEADGQIYTLEWLAEHTAEDYMAAQIPLDKVENALQAAQDKGVDTYIQYAEKAELSLEDAYVLEEAALSSAETVVPEESNETAETGTESSAVVQDETVGSNPAE